MANKWFDHYKGEDVVLLEDVDPTTCERMAHFLKIWLDHYPFIGEVKGGAGKMRPRKWVITSNYTIEQCFNRPEDVVALTRRMDVFEHRHTLPPRLVLPEEHGKYSVLFIHPQQQGPSVVPPPPELTRQRHVTFVEDDSEDEERSGSDTLPMEDCDDAEGEPNFHECEPSC
jgi:hypothetical protein